MRKIILAQKSFKAKSSGGQTRAAFTPVAPVKPNVTVAHTAPKSALAAHTAVLPLRLFLAISFLAAGWDKLSDPQFFDSSAGGYIGSQLSGYANSSPLGGFLNSVAVPNATLFGWLVLVGELAIGLGTLVGLFSRTAAFFGLILSLTLWLTASWGVSPFFLGSDLPYAMGWLILLLAGAHPIYSLDGQWHKKWRSKNGLTRLSRPGVVDTAGVADSGTNQPIPAAILIPTRLMARRRFIAVAGATIFAGGVTSLAWAKSLHDKTEGGTAPEAAANPTTAAPTTSPNLVAAPTNGGTATAASPAATTPSVGTTAPATSGAANATTSASVATSNDAAATTIVPATTSASAVATTTVAPATSAAATTTVVPAIKGTVLAKLSSIAVGNAQKFTVPGSGQAAILIHEQDGSVKAFSTVCTHDGCAVSFVASSQALVCPCHGARFDITNGSATRGPARNPLTSYKVQVDGSGNIVYVQS